MLRDSPRARRSQGLATIAIVFLLFIVACPLAAQFGVRGIAVVVCTAGAAMLIAQIRVLRARCTRCGKLAFWRWAGFSSMAAFGNRCAHCGAELE